MPETEDRPSAARLELLYDMTRRLATFHELDDVVRFATRRARELFEAEGCALILLDRERREFTFPISSQRDSGTMAGKQLADIRFPADRGIAGWVVANDEAALVTDTASDSRFYAGVDRETEVQTRSLLCAPLRSGEGSVGVIEVINPALRFLNQDALRFLEALGNEIAVAYEKAALHEQLRGEVVNLRKIGRAAGYCIAALGAAMLALVVTAHRARVLPWADLPERRGLWLALLLVAGGAVLVALVRDRRR